MDWMIAANFVVCDTFVLTLITVCVEFPFRQFLFQSSGSLLRPFRPLLNAIRRWSDFFLVSLHVCLCLVILVFFPLFSLFLFLVDADLFTIYFSILNRVFVLASADFILFIGFSGRVEACCC